MASQPDGKSKSYERELEIANSIVLKYGVIISCSMIAIGVLIAFLNSGQILQLTLPQLLQSGIGRPSFDAASIAAGLAHLNGLYIVEIGILILLATPVLRVGVTAGMFIAQRDKEYTVIGMFVLVVLLVSLFVVGPYVAAMHV